MKAVINRNTSSTSDDQHPDLVSANDFAYTPSGLIYHHLTQEAESEEYGASIIEINNRTVKFRVGKITPTKSGLFVTLWKRIGNGSIQPYDVADPFDFFVISVRNDERFGQFVFPKSILFEKGIISNEGKGGKRAMRIYPPWNKERSHQAKKTQEWQVFYYFDIHLDGTTDISRVKKLFQNN